MFRNKTSRGLLFTGFICEGVVLLSGTHKCLKYRLGTAGKWSLLFRGDLNIEVVKKWGVTVSCVYGIVAKIVQAH